MDKYTVIVQLAELVAQARREGFNAELSVGCIEREHNLVSEEYNRFLGLSMGGGRFGCDSGDLSDGLRLYVEAVAKLEKMRAEKAERLAKEKAERREQYLKLKAEFYGEGV